MPIIDADLSQIEWRVAAYLSQDPTMIHEINNGIDQHAAACVDLMERELTKENRNDAKIFNFRMIFDGSAYGFYMDNKMPNFTQKKWTTIVDRFKEKYRALFTYHSKNLMEVRNSGGWLRAQSGRYYRFHKRYKQGHGWDYSPSQVANKLIQAMAAEIMKLAIIHIRRKLKPMPEVLLIDQVHDSIIIDCPEKYVDKVATICYNVFIELPVLIEKYLTGKPFNVLLEGEVDVGPTWGEVAPYIGSKCGSPIYHNKGK